jgi:hypothetical protein
MASIYETELENELEQELHELHEGGMHEGEAGLESELGGILSGLFGEGESHEMHEQHEQHELHEQHEGIHEFEMEDEYESGEQFFGKIFRGIGSFVKKAAPILKSVAKVAAPMVGTAIGGPFGAVLGNLASSALGEGELEDEFELHEMHENHEMHEFETHEFHEYEEESAGESESEAAHEIISHELTEHEALAEMMAESAAHEQHEGEAEAMAGAATLTVINPADRRALRAILPHLVRGMAILTRILRRRRATRPAVRAIPTIIRRTVKTLKRNAAAGRPITRKIAAQVAAKEVRKVLGSPRICTAAISRNVKSSRTMKRAPRRRAARG